MPVTLRCNVGDVFLFQDPGTRDDTPEGAEFNRRRDLDILLRSNLVPGVAVTARILFNRLLDRIETVSGICGYDTVTSDAWKGCPKAKSGCCEKGREKGITAIIPRRSAEELEREKRESLGAMYEAKKTGIRSRPHILVCAVCQFGGGTRPPFKPDNLPELIQLIRREPDTMITMAECADWMMCAPCPNRAPELNACVNVKGSGGLTNQLRDLRTLQKLGLTYGSTMNARELYKLIFERTVGTEGVFAEMMGRLGEMGGAKGMGFEAEHVKYVMLLMAEEAGVRMLLFSFVEDALVNDNGVEGAIIANKSGRQAIRAKVTVDATGDADVAFRAGVECKKGRADGHLQAANLMFRVGGIDEAKYAAGAKELGENIQELIARARAAGEIHFPLYLPRVFFGGKGSTIRRGQVSVNIDMVTGVDATDAQELSDAMNTSRRIVFELIDFYRKHVPGAENCHLIDTAALLGVRETRCVVGVSSISAEDVLSARKFGDGICRGSFFLDLHDGQFPRLTPEIRKMLWPPEGDWYEIPYGCLVPEKVDGLLVAGRCISTGRLANGSVRIMPTCMATGQAAGVAAALCAANAVQPRNVDVEHVRATLREAFGVQLADSPGARCIDAKGIRAKLDALFDVPSTR